MSSIAGNHFILHQGKIMRASTEEHIKWCIRSVLSLQKGELTTHPDLGADFMTLMFRRDSPQLREEIKHRISRSVAASEPRVEVEETQISPDEAEPSMLSIRIQYRVKATGRLESLKVLL